MKNLNIFVNEQKLFKAFRVNQDYKPEQYTCQPQDRDELKKIIKERLAKDKDADLNDIDVSQITDMSYLFNREFPHNINISDWDVSNVENMEAMFFWDHDFNCDLSNWDVRNVKSMNNMFDGCEKFEGKGLENWQTYSLKKTYRMFYGCDNFDCDLSNWDMSNATNIACMFWGCKKFKGKGLENWKLNSLKLPVRDTFYGCQSLHKKPSWYEKYYY